MDKNRESSELTMKRKMGKTWLNKIFKGSILSLAMLAFLLVAFSLLNLIMKGSQGVAAGLASRELRFAMRLSFLTASVSTILCAVFAVPIAYALERMRLPGRRFVQVVLNVPLSLPPLVSGFALLLLFGTTSFGKSLSAWGLDFVFTVKGIILAQFFVNLPYLIRIMKATFSEINPRLEFVAKSLGCSDGQAFFKVMLPLARNGLFAGLVITWAKALGEFGAALMLAGATRMKTETLPVALYLNMSIGNLEMAMVAATILIAISMISLIVFEILREYLGSLGGDY